MRISRVFFPSSDLYQDLEKISEIDSPTEFQQELKNVHSRFLSSGILPPFQALSSQELAKAKILASPLSQALIRKQDLRLELSKYTNLSPAKKEDLLHWISLLENALPEELLLKKKELRHLLLLKKIQKICSPLFEPTPPKKKWVWRLVRLPLKKKPLTLTDLYINLGLELQFRA